MSAFGAEHLFVAKAHNALAANNKTRLFQPAQTISVSRSREIAERNRYA
jgi:hypothetical protein